MTAPSPRTRVLSALRWLAAGRLVGQTLSWAVTIVVIRLLRPEDYGLMAVAMMFVGFLTLLNDAGLGAAMIQRASIDDEMIGRVFCLILVVNTLCCLLLVAAAPALAVFFADSRLAAVIQVLALQFIVMSFVTVPQSLLERDLQFRKRSLADFTSNATGSLVTLVMAYLGKGVWALVFGNLSQLAVNAVLLNIAHGHVYRPILSIKGLRDFATFGGYVAISRALWYLFVQADIFIGGRLLGNQLLGFYAVARQLAWLPMDKLGAVINQVAFPAFSRVQEHREKIGAYILMSVRTVSFLVFPLCIGISAIAPEIVSVLLGDRWTPAILPLQLLSLIVPLRIVFNMTSPVILALARADTALGNLLVSSILMPIAFLVGCQFGIIGLSVAWVIALPVCFLIRLPSTLRVFGLRAREFLGAMARPALSSACMYAAVAAVRSYSPTWPASLFRLGLLIVTAIVAYGLVVGTVNRGGFREVLGLVRG
jgi:teichuronic acid exporter